MRYITTLAIAISIISCRHSPEKFNYETSIASKVYEAQLKYLDVTLSGYARFSKTAEFYYNESTYLDKTALDFQSKIKNGSSISEEEKKDFYDHFEKTFTHNGLIDFEILNQIKELPIKTISDVDLLRVYIKNNFVSILLSNKFIPFNAWSVLASAKEWTVEKGQPFELTLATTAWNTQLPSKWFLVKKNNDSLTKDNIIDTLYQDLNGEVKFSTKNYKIGENKLMFRIEMNTPKNNPALGKVVTFYVK